MTPDEPSHAEPRTVQLSGGPASYIVEGEGPDLVLVHGLPGSVRDFRWLTPALEGLRVWRLDLPGWGDTPIGTARGLTAEARGVFVAEAVQALGIDRCLLGGHSMGGPVMTAAGERLGERVAGYVLISCPGLRKHRLLRESKAGFFSAILRTPLRHLLMGRLRSGFTKAGFSRNLRDDQLLRSMHTVAALDFPAHVERLRRVRVPCFMTWCADDRLIEDAVPNELSGVLPAGPRLRFETGGHNPQKTGALEIGQALVPWAREVAGSQPSGSR